MRSNVPAAVVCGGLVAAVAVAALARAPAPPTLVVAQGEGTFQIAGDIDGLYPGADMTLQATVTNPSSVPIEVQHLSASVRDASSECPAAVLQVGDFNEPVAIVAGGTATIPLDVRLALAAPDSCQGATWPLAFEGTAQAVLDERLEDEEAPPGDDRGGDEATRQTPGWLPATGAGIAIAVALAVVLLATGQVSRWQSRRASR